MERSVQHSSERSGVTRSWEGRTNLKFFSSLSHRHPETVEKYSQTKILCLICKIIQQHEKLFAMFLDGRKKSLKMETGIVRIE